ncbi:MAG: glycosyltransferase family 4 protein [Acidimicrobiales bacterium]
MSRYNSVHQFHSGTALGDAITNQMLYLQRELQEMGFVSEIFGEHIPPGLQDRIRSIHAYRGSDTELLLLHHSSGHDVFDEVIDLPNDIVAIYHNVTPEHYFKDDGARRYIRLGREQLALLSRRTSVGVADSNFNRREMLAAGFRRVEVLPVRTDFREFQPVDENRARPSNDWLYVGRLVRNKCQHELVNAFAIYSRNFGGDARLVLVGDTSDSDYVSFVRDEADRLKIADRVVLLGKVSDGQLRSAFAGAGVFVSMSEHEGFGVPILEAMAAGVPVIAFGAAAVPETMNGAGVLLRTKAPAVVAATVQSVQSDPELRHRLIERQFIRVRQVGEFDTRALLQRVIDRASGIDVPIEIQIQGPFETSYSLAFVNRQLALGLEKSPDQAVSIYATEGPGDYQPAASDLAQHPEAAQLFHRSKQIPFPDVVIRQMYPPRVIDTPGGITCEYFGWEESRIPKSVAEDFNRYLDGVGVMSGFVRDVLRDSGVNIPICVVGIGVETPNPGAVVDAPELVDLRTFRFLHISSAFPRKGVDVLLKAYFSAFDGTDDVTLILKTFPNPHNQVADVLKALIRSHPNPPDVRWIDRDLDDREIEGFYRLASCYVHPARGEGFGLPVADAMAANVPVISVAYSGLADFVSEQTAVTIPFTIEPAETHLDVPDSEWAEPDREALAVAMRRLADDPRDPAVLDRVRQGRDLIGDRFSWNAVAKRWETFIRDLEEGVGTLRVAMVTTWNTRCGIAENTRYLVEHSRGLIDYELFADVDVEPIDPSVELGVVRTWKNRWEPDLSALEKALRLADASVVHVQFNFGFFEFRRMADLIDRQLERRGVVVTFHRTRDYFDQGELLTLRDIKPTLERVDRIIVHQASDAQYLAELGLAENVTLVPLGTSPSPAFSPADVREALNLGSRPIVGTFGFLLPHKGTLELLRVVDALREEFPDILLLALCARYPDIISEDYEDQIHKEIASRGLDEHVLLITDYLGDEEARGLLRAADVIVLPYHETGESSSAALRFLLPLGRAVVVTDEPIFADARDALLMVDPADPIGIESGVRRVLMDDDLRRDLADRSATRARRFRWDRVIGDHREIYLSALRAGKDRRARRESYTSA